MPALPSTLIPGLRYSKALAAIDWLEKVFGFERKAVYEGENGVVHHAELVLGNGMIMLGTGKDDEYSRNFKSPGDLGGVQTCGLYLVVPDADAAHARAVAAEAVVVRPLQDTPYGSREFTVTDPEGHTWTAGTYDPWCKHE
ncbi:MAG: VOC family protein [Terracidiphilus sp.]